MVYSQVSIYFTVLCNIKHLKLKNKEIKNKNISYLFLKKVIQI